MMKFLTTSDRLIMEFTIVSIACVALILFPYSKIVDYPVAPDLISIALKSFLHELL